MNTYRINKVAENLREMALVTAPDIQKLLAMADELELATADQPVEATFFRSVLRQYHQS